MRKAERWAVGSESSQSSAACFLDSGVTRRALDSLPPTAVPARLRGHRAFVDASCSQSCEFALDWVAAASSWGLCTASRLICSSRNADSHVRNLDRARAAAFSVRRHLPTLGTPPSRVAVNGGKSVFQKQLEQHAEN